MNSKIPNQSISIKLGFANFGKLPPCPFFHYPHPQSSPPPIHPSTLSTLCAFPAYAGKRQNEHNQILFLKKFSSSVFFTLLDTGSMGLAHVGSPCRHMSLQTRKVHVAFKRMSSPLDPADHRATTSLPLSPCSRRPNVGHVETTAFNSLPFISPMLIYSLWLALRHVCCSPFATLFIH